MSLILNVTEHYLPDNVTILQVDVISTSFNYLNLILRNHAWAIIFADRLLSNSMS